MGKRRWWWAVASLVALTGCPSEGGSGGNGGAGGAAGLGGLGGTAGSGGVGGMTGGTGGSTGGTGGVITMTGGTGGTTTGGTGGSLEDICDPNATPKDGPCKEFAEGVYAMHIVLDTHWGTPGDPAPVADAGRGNLDIYMMGTIDGVCEDGSGGTGTIQACGTVLPPLFSDVTCSVYQVEFPDTIWESPNIPKFTTTGMTSGFNVGDVLSLAKETGLVGISLTDKNGPWPTTAEAGSFVCPEGMGAACYPDHDGDGKPGITVKIKNTGEEVLPDGCTPFGTTPFLYRAAPLDILQGIAYDPAGRTETVQIGLRLSVGGEGAIAECSATAGGQGAAMADNPESRLYSCQTVPGVECTPTQAAFVDENLPVYTVLNEGEMPPATLTKPKGGSVDQTPSEGPRTRVVRLGNVGETFTCAQVRAAAYPDWAPALYVSPEYH